MSFLRVTDPAPRDLFRPPVLVGSLGLIGFAPFARGTFGTLLCFGGAAVLIGFPFAAQAWLPLALGFSVLSWWMGRVVVKDKRLGNDPGWFVLDEAAGYFLTLGVLGAVSLLDIFAAFVTFRLYDIAKPWPVRTFERIRGSAGILLDDLAAGVLAAWTWQAILILNAAYG